MATSWELKKQQAEAAAKQRALIKGVTGTIAEEVLVKSVMEQGIRTGGAQAVTAKGFNAAQVIGTAIEFIGAAGIAAWQFATARKTAKKKERITKKQQINQDGIEGLLQIIGDTGVVLVEEHGIDPTTAEFEKILYDNLYKEIGYRGNCNINAPMPGQKTGEGPVWFRVTNNGRIFEPVNMDTVPPNIQTFWRVKCKNLKDIWANAYQDLLIQQGRVRELEAFQADYNKGKKILRISFGIIFGILLIIAIRYGVKIK